ncbi:MAG TPA: hypothetical protein VGD89_09940 [Flavipsychrobacter sp.]
MDDGFILTVEYKGKTYELETKFVRIGFIHQFHVHVDGRTLVFEFDEEGDCRVIDASGDISKPMDAGLIEAIVHKVSSLH